MSKEYKYILDGTELVVNPSGWDDLGIKYTRSETYHSIRRKFTTQSLQFPIKSGFGGDVILAEYNINGINGSMTIQIYERNGQTDDYDLLYFSGILNFRTIQIERDYIEIKLADSSKQQKFHDREEIEYNIKKEVSTDDIEITPFVNSPTQILFKTINLYLNMVSSGEFIVPASNYLSATYFNFDGTININEIGDRISIADPALSATVYTNTLTQSSIIASGNITGSYSVNAASQPAGGGGINDGAFAIQYIVYNDLGALVSTQADNIIYLKEGDPQQVYSGTFDIDFTNIGIFENWRLDLRLLVINAEVFSSDIQVTNFSFKEVTTGRPDNNINCFYPYEAFTRLIQLSTSETDTDKLLYSEILGRTDSEFQTYDSNGEASETVITNGYNLRKFPNRAINVTIKDLFKSFDSLYNLGLGFDRVNDRFFISEKSDFFKPQTMFDLGEVTDLIRTPYEYPNQILCGYTDDISYEESNGTTEFNVNSERSVNINIKEKLDLSCPYHADSMGMEFARRKIYNAYPTEDTNYDDNIYLCDTLNGETVQGGTSLSGVDGIKERYNLKLTPRENLIRWGNVLKSILWKDSTSPIKFVKSQKETDITYENQNGELVSELDDIQQSELSERIYDYERHTFEAPINASIIEELDSDPHRLIDYTFDGIRYRGFLLDVETNRYDETASWEVIQYSTEETDTNWIYEDEDNVVFENDNNSILEK